VQGQAYADVIPLPLPAARRPIEPDPALDPVLDGIGATGDNGVPRRDGPLQSGPRDETHWMGRIATRRLADLMEQAAEFMFLQGDRRAAR